MGCFFSPLFLLSGLKCRWVLCFCWVLQVGVEALGPFSSDGWILRFCYFVWLMSFNRFHVWWRKRKRFLLTLDLMNFFAVSAPAGFPDHPHRGWQIPISYHSFSRTLLVFLLFLQCRRILLSFCDLVSGFETVTYMLDGAFTHQDFAGHKGTIRTGDLQVLVLNMQKTPLKFENQSQNIVFQW